MMAIRVLILILGVGLLVPCFGAYDELIGVGARPIGLGGAYVAIAEGGAGLYYNPAGVTFQKEGKEAYLLGGKGFGGILNYGYGAILQEGLGFSYFRSECNLRSKRNPQSEMREYYYNLTFGFTLQQLIPKLKEQEPLSKLALGASLKLQGIESAIDSVTGLGADIGVIYPITFSKGKYNLGLAIKNIVAKLREEEIRTKIRAGIAVSLDRPKITVAADITNLRDYQEKDKSELGYYVGLEYAPFPLLFFRVGVNNGDFACGSSISLPTFSLDYAYHQASLIEALNNHFLALTLKF